MSISSPEIEGSVLASLVTIGTRNDIQAQEAFLKLSVKSFTALPARDIFTILARHFEQGLDFDFVTVYDLMTTQSQLYFMQFLDAHYSLSNLSQYIDTLLDNQELRRRHDIIGESLNIVSEAKAPSELLRKMDEKLQELNKVTTNQQDYVQTTEQIIERFLQRDESDCGIKTTIHGLPDIPNQSLITIAARPGVGKTMLALYLMDEIVNVVKKPALYFNMEMQDYVLLERHALLLGGKGFTQEDIIASKIIDIHSKNISYVSRAGITIEEIETCSRLQALKSPLSVIVVDYIGLITSKNKSERNDLHQANVAKRLAALSLDLNCRVIALTQVNRDYKNRAIGDRVPYPADCAESMGTVHSSTWWIGIDRPEIDSSDPQWKGLFQIRCRKNRGKEGLFETNLDLFNGRFFPHKQRYSNPCPVVPIS